MVNEKQKKQTTLFFQLAKSGRISCFLHEEATLVQIVDGGNSLLGTTSFFHCDYFLFCHVRYDTSKSQDDG